MRFYSIQKNKLLIAICGLRRASTRIIRTVFDSRYPQFTIGIDPEERFSWSTVLSCDGKLLTEGRVASIPEIRFADFVGSYPKIALSNLV